MTFRRTVVKKQTSLFDTELTEDEETTSSGKSTSKAYEPDYNDGENAPLAHRIRPEEFSEFIGHSEIFQKYPYLRQKNFPSLILFGPSGTGKTTLARLLAKLSGKEFYTFNAVLGGVADLKKIIAETQKIKESTGRYSIIFIDEIHRFNKAQQDALLPYIEVGSFTLIGATTENPRVSVNKALLSRMHIIELKILSAEAIETILSNALKKSGLTLSEELVKVLASYAGGDARVALNSLEATLELENPTKETVKQLIIDNARAFDKGGNRHYDVISAFIKSMRGSDPQAAILWLAVMIDGGEDPVFIARRLVIFASEDVGNADPTALTLATNALHAVSQIGMPEARIILAHATTYLASTFKSNAAYLAIDQALEYVRSQGTIEVPNHLRNYPPPNTKPYLYPHSYPGHWVKQDYSPMGTPKFYEPTTEGREDGIKKRLDSLN
ncbi:replication-associated recombination protein A [Bacteriovorax stolpii]|nr:replication-associated recombination protein A [Bacteriovorax stolpii]